MASVKQIKGYIAANKKALVQLQAKVKKQEAALKKAVAAEKKKVLKKRRVYLIYKLSKKDEKNT
jgi:hypothetical protein